MAWEIGTIFLGLPLGAWRGIGTTIFLGLVIYLLVQFSKKQESLKETIKQLTASRNGANTMSYMADTMHGAPLFKQKLVISIPRNFAIEIAIHGDELKREDFAKIKSEVTRWIEGLKEQATV